MFHQTMVIGNVGKDPESRYTPSGQAVTSFSVAANRSYTSSDGQTVKETCWYRVTTWGKLAEVCHQYVKKGSLVLIVGRMTPDKETGGPKVWSKKDGAASASYELTADTVRFLSKSEAAAMTSQTEAAEVESPF